ncbi:MAG: class I SAM-dependent methyltransferase [Candidatus Aminicenantes bacterium]|nr:class I SAM-dependent methyltransferase [Candidatus Aminicenantes bacterium]
MKILDIGCGKQKSKKTKPDDIVIGLDITKKGTEADITHDLDVFPYPFQNNEFDMIICFHTIEHLEDIPQLMSELWRITKNNGIIKILTPAWNSVFSYTDITHKHHLTPWSFDYWDSTTKFGKKFNHYTSKNTHFKIRKRRILFENQYKYLFIESLANIFPKIYSIFFGWIFPATELYFELQTKK